MFVCVFERAFKKYRSLFKEVVSWRLPQPATLLKKRLWRRVFSCELCEISKNTFSYRTPPLAASLFSSLSSITIFQKICNTTYILKIHAKIVKGATKLYFTHYLCVVILFSNKVGFRQICIFYLISWKTVTYQ